MDHTATLSSPYPSLDQLRRTADRLRGKVIETPVWRWQTGIIERALSPATEVWLKLELFQRTGTFKRKRSMNHVLEREAAT